MPGEIRKYGYFLTLDRVVSSEEREENDEPFEDKMKRLDMQPHDQQAEGTRLYAGTAARLKAIVFVDRGS